MNAPADSFKDLSQDAQHRIASALMILVDAFVQAIDAKKVPSLFAIEVATLRGAGLTHSDFRWLLCKQFAEHVVDSSLPGEPERRMHPTSAWNWNDASCLALTSKGHDFARTIVSGHCQETATIRGKTGQTTSSDVPVWNRDRRELTFRGRVIRRLRVGAKNQRAILSAFEEEGWPPQIADPIPPHGDGSSRDRLSKAVYDLNCGLEQNVLSFRCVDGTRVGWTCVSARNLRQPTRTKRTHRGKRHRR